MVKGINRYKTKIIKKDNLSITFNKMMIFTFYYYFSFLLMCVLCLYKNRNIYKNIITYRPVKKQRYFIKNRYVMARSLELTIFL